MKKIIALLLSLLLVIGIFAGCGNTAPGGADTQASTSGEEDKVQTPGSAGSLIVNASAAVTITYGEDGLVLSMEGINDDGIDLVGSYEEEPFGSSCVDIVKQLITDCVVKNYMFETNHVVVKLNKGSALPGTNFVESIKTAAQSALDTAESSAALVMITEENLTADGYIDLATAKVLVERFLQVEKVDGFDGLDKPVDGLYAFDVVYGIMEERLMVNAETGSVSQGSIEELDQILDEQEDNSAEETTHAEGLLAEATAPDDEASATGED